MKAPTRKPDQSAADYLMAVAAFLNRPARRRMGNKTFTQVRAAIKELDR